MFQFATLVAVAANLSANATLLGAQGTSTALAPLGSSYVSVPIGGDGMLRPHESKTVTLTFSDPSGDAITYDARVVNVTPTP